MKYNIFIFFIIIICYLTRYIGNAVDINVLFFSFDDSQSMYETLLNKYNANNQLNVTVHVEMLKYEKSTDSLTYFKPLVESLLKKSDTHKKYDIYFYDNKYTDIYGQYLLDLKDNLPQELINMYSANTINRTCTYKDKLVGLPIGLSYEVLYSNKELLTKYNKPIPKTWDELIDTCKYIMEREKDDTELICYNGLFDDTEQGLVSLYEFIYSCRDSVNSTYPDPKDPAFLNSLKMMNRIKNEVASDTIFSSNENFTFGKLMNAKSIFLKYWFVGEPLLSGLRYYISLIPGLNEGVSGSMVAGCNVGIIKEIDPEKKDIAFEVVKYIVSKEYQREIFRSVTAITAVTELLDDPEICQLVPCEVIKKIQITGEPQFLREGPEDYRKQYQNYIYQYLYGKMPLEMTQKKIIDVTKIYDVGLGLENSALGLVVFILFMLLSSLMLLSLIFVFRDNFHPFFKFLHDDFWILTVLGSIVILCAPLVGYGQVNALKCHLQPCLISIGYTLSVGPTLHKLITQFPEKNKVVIWICKYRHTFIVMILILDVIMNGISFLDPFTAKLIVADNGEKFKICQSPGVYFMVILSTYKTLFTLLILFFIFVEWNTVAILYDVRFVVAAIYIDILSFILISVFHVIQINNYMTYFIIQTLNTSIIALSNYIILYGIRLMLAYIREHNIRLKFINTINENFINNEGLLHTRSNHHNSFNDTFSSSRHRSEMENQGRTMTSTIRRTNFISRMINYHNSNGMLSSDPMTVTTTTTSS